MACYAGIIIDISHEKLDRVFTYRIPEKLCGKVYPGVSVQIPFGKGNRIVKGFAIELRDSAEFDEDKIKDIVSVIENDVEIEAQLIALAAWMRSNYGGTMNQALKTVLPVKTKAKAKEKRFLCLCMEQEEAKEQLSVFMKKHHTARARLLTELLCHPKISYDLVTQKLNVSASVIRALEEKQVVKTVTEVDYRNPTGCLKGNRSRIALNEMQKRVVEEVLSDRKEGVSKIYLLHGVTGSGKTEVYMELIADTLMRGMQAIVLIPEIALTYQTVMRLYGRFGERVSILNSRMSKGERYDQFLRAKNGEIDIMIGPRSALFTPFLHLGLIIIDEEHEGSYKSESLPKYHARETAIARAKLAKASVVLGSATPSVDSYYKARTGEYRLLTMASRVKQKPLPICEVVDLREELRKGNRSVLSFRLQELIEERLKKKQQVMLFLNRRGMSGFVSCRACGHVMKCPHCDVSLSLHKNGKMVCHYCGHEEVAPSSCPECGSSYISGFKAGTQKIEEIVKIRFPSAKTLRMDFDTTRRKDSYERILSAFADGEADILIGTQMIVKGHDFKNVTLVGVIAADLSLYAPDYRAAERTFQLLTQAAGRAGRGDAPGEVVIQTYHPDHYSIVAAKAQDYEAFYQKEILVRKLASYPPVSNLLLLLLTSKEDEEAERMADLLAGRAAEEKMEGLVMIGPASAVIGKIDDKYRKVIYFKHKEYAKLVELKDKLELFLKDREDAKQISLSFDFNPMNGI